MIPLTDTSIMPYGKHKGKTLEDVPASYLLWLYDQEGFPTRNPDLATYIASNMNALEQEADEDEEDIS